MAHLPRGQPAEGPRDTRAGRGTQPRSGPRIADRAVWAPSTRWGPRSGVPRYRAPPHGGACYRGASSACARITLVRRSAGRAVTPAFPSPAPRRSVHRATVCLSTHEGAPSGSRGGQGPHHGCLTPATGSLLPGWGRGHRHPPLDRTREESLVGALACPEPDNLLTASLAVTFGAGRAGFARSAG